MAKAKGEVMNLNEIADALTNAGVSVVLMWSGRPESEETAAAIYLADLKVWLRGHYASLAIKETKSRSPEQRFHANLWVTKHPFGPITALAPTELEALAACVLEYLEK